MKKVKFNVSLVLLLVLANAAFGFPEKLNKKLHHDFDVKKGSELVIRNKFGKVDVQNWDQQKVSIDVVITVDYANREKAEKLLSYIDVEFSTDGNKLQAITQIDDRFNRIRNNGWRSDGKEFSIDYTVKMPSDLTLDLLNKYGDIFINKLSGQTRIEVKYGNLKINKLTRGNTDPMATVVLGYSNGTIEEANWLKVKMKYSKLEFTRAKALLVNSAYSKLYIDKVSSIVADSKYDTYRVGTAQNFVVEGAYSNYKFEFIGNKLILDTRYTGTTVQKVDANFAKISIDNEYGGIKLGIDRSASYLLKAHAKYASISYPEKAKVSRIIENTSTSVDGVIGSNPAPKAEVRIETRYGSVNLIY